MQEMMLSTIYGIPDNQMGTMTFLGINKAMVADDSFSVIMEVRDLHLNTQY